ncbi:MAG: aminotransferase class I/II-fold pyridoxal phosphate-dependent enzyme [Propionibacteriaceae bacterium]|jgi:threonine-phosphate decarboxylase|nr:aminotransferase class I/II-fold pyridoxal phosphate-dependent enzyme [Propionibacteriaceae bacterium]
MRGGLFTAPCPRRTIQSVYGAPHSPSTGYDDHGGDLVAHPGARLDFSVNVNPLGTPAPVRQAIVDGLTTMGQYPDPWCRGLRQALADHHGIDPAMIVCGNGASDVIHRVVAVRRPRRVLTPAPTFTEYARSALATGAEVVHHRLMPPLFDLDDTFLDRLTSDIDMVFLCQPNNPTGRLIGSDLLAAVIDRAAQIGATVVIDECFLPFTDADSVITTKSPADSRHRPGSGSDAPPTDRPGPMMGRQTPPLSDQTSSGDTSASRADLPPHVIVIRAFTKTHGMAGLRLGYAVSTDRHLIAAMAAQPPHWNVSSLAQVAGRAAVGLSEWDERTRALVRAERAYLTEELTRLGLGVVGSDANFLLFRCDRLALRPDTARRGNEEATSHQHDLHSALLDQGILIRACASFIGLDETYFRVGLHSRADNVTLVEALWHALDHPEPGPVALIPEPQQPHPHPPQRPATPDQHPDGGTP